MNYRKFYEKKTGILLPENFEVHHIDLNRRNNYIENLVALPVNTHREYHRKLNEAINCIDAEPITTELLIPGGGFRGTNNLFPLILNSLKEYHRVFDEVQIWISYRDHLLGYIPNFNNISYES